MLNFSSNNPGKQILILILQHKLPNEENPLAHFEQNLSLSGKKARKKCTVSFNPKPVNSTVNIHNGVTFCIRTIALSICETIHTFPSSHKGSYKLFKWWGNMCISEHNLENFHFALKDVKSKIIIFKLIKLQTVGSYEYSKHPKSAHQGEIRGSICFILMFLKNSTKLPGYRHGIKLFSKTHSVYSQKGKKKPLYFWTYFNRKLPYENNMVTALYYLQGVSKM